MPKFYLKSKKMCVLYICNLQLSFLGLAEPYSLTT